MYSKNTSKLTSLTNVITDYQIPQTKDEIANICIRWFHHIPLIIEKFTVTVKIS